MFTLDTSIGEFVLTHPNVKLPDRGSIYSMNEARDEGKGVGRLREGGGQTKGETD